MHVSHITLEPRTSRDSVYSLQQLSRLSTEESCFALDGHVRCGTELRLMEERSLSSDLSHPKCPKNATLPIRRGYLQSQSVHPIADMAFFSRCAISQSRFFGMRLCDCADSAINSLQFDPEEMRRGDFLRLQMYMRNNGERKVTVTSGIEHRSKYLPMYPYMRCESKVLYLDSSKIRSHLSYLSFAPSRHNKDQPQRYPHPSSI